MVCCVCVLMGMVQVILFRGELKGYSRLLSFSLTGDPEEPSRIQLRMLSPLAVCSVESLGLQLPPVFLYWGVVDSELDRLRLLLGSRVRINS